MHSYFKLVSIFISLAVLTGCDRSDTAAALVEVMAELESYDEAGLDTEEFEYMRSAIGQRDAREYETPGCKLALLDNILTYDLPLDYRTQQNEILRAITREKLNQVAARLIDLDNMAVVVVGDEATTREELEALGMPIVELCEDGFIKDASE